MKPEEKKLQKSLAEDAEQFLERKKQLENAAPDDSKHGGDFYLPAHNRHQEAHKTANIDQKVYLFPESFNALRRELEENWREFFHTVNPLTNTSPAWCMVFDAPQFIGYCNGATGLAVQMDSEAVDEICKTFLNAFRKMRGVKEIH